LSDAPSGPDVFAYDNPDWARQLILQFRYNVPVAAHDHMARITTAYVNKVLRFAAPPASTDVSAQLESLQTNGYCRLGQLLSKQAVARIKEYLANQSVFDEADPTLGQFATDAAPPSVNVANFSASSVVNAPYLHEAAMSPDILHLVSRYLGAPPTIPYLAAWWSYAGREEAKDAQLFHTDFHDFKWLKLFVYLTDVTESSGPHVVVRGSHDPGLGQRRIAEINESDSKLAQGLERAFAPGQRVTEQDIDSLFGRDSTESITGAAGEAFLVDTSAYHKGQLPVDTDRLVFQALFTILPTIRDHVAPITISGAYESYRASAKERAVPEAFWAYSTRLIIRDPKISSQ